MLLQGIFKNVCFELSFTKYIKNFRKGIDISGAFHWTFCKTRLLL